MEQQSSTTPHALIFGLSLEKAISVLAKKPLDATHYNYLEDDEYNTYTIIKPEWSKLNKHAYLHVDALTYEHKWLFMPNALQEYNLIEGCIDLVELQQAVEQQYLVFEQYLTSHGVPIRKIDGKYSFVSQLLLDAWVKDPELAIKKFNEMQDTKISLQVPLHGGENQHD